MKVRVPSFFTALTLIADSDMVLTVLERFVKRTSRRLPLASRAAPIEIPGFGVWQVWHERAHHDPEHGFLRRYVARAAR